MSKKLLVSFLLVAVMLPAGFIQAAVYTPYPGQSIDIAKTSLNPASVNVKLADLYSISAQTFGISIFGNNYTLDVSTAQFLNSAGSPITSQSFTAGNRINVIGTLDATTPFLIHALVVRNMGTSGIVSLVGGTQPTIDLTANPTTVNPGATSVLAWNSTNATVCYGGKVGDWPSLVSLNQAPSSTVPLYTTTSWSITCLGAASTTPATDTVTVTVTVTQSTNCDARTDLTYTEIQESGNTASASITNNSASCTYHAGLASYRAYDRSDGSSQTQPFIMTQQLNDSDLRNIAPGQTINVDASLPSCAYQADLFEGPNAPVPPSFGLLTATHTLFTWADDQSLPLCGTTAPPIDPTLPVVILTVTKNGTGTGVVTGNPAGNGSDDIDCGSNCAAPFASGTTVTLTAASSADSVFVGWTNCQISSSTSITVTMDVAKTCNARFNTSGGGGSTTGLCASGAQDSQQGGLVEWLGEPVIALVRQALGCSSNWALEWPMESMRAHGSANYKILWRTWNYGVAMRIGTEEQKTDARNYLINLLDRELVEGHNFDEALTTSHYQIHLHGMAAARLLAVHYNDARLLAATGKWWRQEFSLYDLLGRNGVVYSPGWRSSEPTSPLRDVVYAMVKGRSLPGNAGSPTSNWWSDYYHVGAWTLRNLLRMGDDLGGAAQATKDSESPMLPNTLCVYTRGNDFVFVFPKMTRGIDVLFWVARINGAVSQAPYDPGGAPGNNPYPAPALPGSQLQIVPGIGGDTSGCVPQ